MTDYERGSGPEIAGPEQLEPLYRHASGWLQRHGQHFMEPADMIGGFEPGPEPGSLLPITETGPVWTYEISDESLRRFVPVAADVLDLESVELVFQPAYHEPYEDESIGYVAPSCRFELNKRPVSAYRQEVLTIHHDPDDPAEQESWWRSGRISHIRREPEQESSKLTALEAAGMLHQLLSADNPITKLEAEMLQEIVDNLDGIKQFGSGQ